MILTCTMSSLSSSASTAASRICEPSALPLTDASADETSSAALMAPLRVPLPGCRPPFVPAPSARTRPNRSTASAAAPHACSSLCSLLALLTLTEASWATLMASWRHSARLAHMALSRGS